MILGMIEMLIPVLTEIFCKTAGDLSCCRPAQVPFAYDVELNMLWISVARSERGITCSFSLGVGTNPSEPARVSCSAFNPGLNLAGRTHRFTAAREIGDEPWSRFRRSQGSPFHSCRVRHLR